MRFSTIFVLLFTARALAQQSAPQPSADELTHAWVQHMADADSSPTPADQQKYTYLIHHHDLTWVKGKLTDDHTFTSEQIFIGGLPYTRRLEKDGKPLKGKDLKHETELYEQAVRERTGLSQARIPPKSHSIHTNGLPKDHLEADFSHKITGADTINGHLFVVLDLCPLDPNASPDLQRHIRVTIDPNSLDVIHFWVEYLASSDRFGKGTIMENNKTYIDGVLLPESSKLETTIATNRDNIAMNLHILSTDTFSDYKRFTTSTTIRPADPN